MDIRRWIIWGVSVPAALTLAHLVSPGVATAGNSYLNVYNVVVALSIGLMAAGIDQHQPQPKWPWLAMTSGLGLWLCGDLAYTTIGGSPTASLADVYYAVGYGAVITGLLVILHHRLPRRDVDRGIDVAIAVIGASYLMWELVARPMLNTEGASVAGWLMTSLYPVAGVVILVLLLQLVLSPGPKGFSLAMLFLAVAGLITADLLYAVAASNSDFASYGRVIDSARLIGYVAFAAAACHPSSIHLARRDDAARSDNPYGQVAVAAVSLLSVPVVVVVTANADHQPATAALTVVALVLVALIAARFLRQTHAVESSRRLVQQHEAYYRRLAHHSSDVHLVVGPDGNVIDASVALISVLGASSVEEFQDDPMSFVHSADQALVTALVEDVRVAPGRSATGEVRLSREGSAERWIELRCTNLLDDPAVQGVVINAHEITARKHAENELEYQAFHDALTGLPNRALFRDRVEHALARLERHGGDVAVLFCDLDDFKSINDTLGHGAGDELLCQVAARIASAVRTGDTVARLGGDEFAILLEGDGSVLEEAHVVTRRILDAMAGPVDLDGSIVVTTGSIGIATASQGAISSSELLRNADLAMYGSKRRGRGHHELFEPSMAVAAMDRRDLEADLRLAIERDQLRVHYQPVIELDDNRIVGFEALVRWEHHDRGLLPPSDFIGIAEETGLIVDIGEWVLRTACTTARRWDRQRDLRHAPLTVSVNVSARQLEDPLFDKKVLQVLLETGMPGKQLVLELTETVLVEQSADVARRLQAVKDLGVKIAIDDFGTGYSSLGYLREFPVDIVKIDRSFIETITDVEQVPAIIHGLIELGRSLSLEMVAEGIEDEVQLKSLIDQGCDRGQGYVIAHPLDELTAGEVARTRKLQSTGAGIRPSSDR